MHMIKLTYEQTNMKLIAYSSTFIVGLVSFFIIVLILFQTYYISKDTTTSEEVRKKRISLPTFKTSCQESWSNFMNSPFIFRRTIDYNSSALELINKNRTLDEVRNNSWVPLSKGKEDVELAIKPKKDVPREISFVSSDMVV